MLKRFATSCAALFFIAAAPANAAPLLFTITGTDTASFLLDSTASFTPVHLNGNPSFDYDQYHNISGMFDGAQRNFDFDIYDAASGGGFQLETTDTKLFISPIGPLVFQGTLANPVLAPGTFSFTQDYTRGAINDKLVISVPGVNSAVPEPATWALMILGFGVIGYVMRRATKVANANGSDNERRTSDLSPI